MIVGTAGHIDHGKTALVRALTGVDTDRLPEEKRRGITIELGFAPLELPGVGTVGIVDVPGHEAFVRTMVAGAAGIDLGMLIVAADEGIMPQTREHLTILDLLAVRAGIIVLTKCDLADSDWIELVKDDLRELARGTVLHDAPIIETSAKDRTGIEELKQSIAHSLSALASRDANDVFRLPVDRSFTVKGTGTVVTGTSWSGRLRAGAEVRLFPGDRPIRVRGIQHHGHPAEEIGPGARAALALVGVEVAEVPRGSVLVAGGHWQSTTRLHAEVRVEAGAAPLRAREWLHLHVGTSEVSARVVPIAGAVSPTGALVTRVVLEAPLVLRAGDRFVLRRSQPLSTVGGGRVIDPSPLRRRSRPRRAWSERPDLRLEDAMRDAGVTGLQLESIPVRVGVDLEESRRLTMSSLGTVVESRLVLEEFVAAAEQVVADAIFRFHDLNPGDSGLATARLRSDLPGIAGLVDRVVTRLATKGRVEVVSGLVRAKGWQPRVSAEAEELKGWLVERLVAAGLEPPSVGELKVEKGVDVLPALRGLEKQALVVGVEPDRFYAATALQGGLDRLAQTMRDGGTYTPAQLREVLGVSRKFLMPLLEYCDRRRITERRGEGRVLLASPLGSSQQPATSRPQH